MEDYIVLLMYQIFRRVTGLFLLFGWKILKTVLRNLCL
jgi:hypothetical protein